MPDHYTVLPFFTSDTGEAKVSSITCNEVGVPTAFLRNCGTWEGTARRVSAAGELIDEHLVRVEIAIAGTDYVQTNTVRIGTPREVVAKYFGNFQDGKLVFPLTDEVYTLGGEKASGFSGVAWSVTDEIVVYCGSRIVQGCKTHYHEVITLSDRDPHHNNESQHRVRTTQLFEDGIYKLVTMIDEARVAS